MGSLPRRLPAKSRPKADGATLAQACGMTDGRKKARGAKSAGLEEGAIAKLHGRNLG